MIQRQELEANIVIGTKCHTRLQRSVVRRVLNGVAGFMSGDAECRDGRCAIHAARET